MIRVATGLLLFLLACAPARADSLAIFIHFTKAPTIRLQSNGGEVQLHTPADTRTDLYLVPTPAADAPAAPARAPAAAPAAARPTLRSKAKPPAAAEPETMARIPDEEDRRQALRAFLSKKAPRK